MENIKQAEIKQAEVVFHNGYAIGAVWDVSSSSTPNEWRAKRFMISVSQDPHPANYRDATFLANTKELAIEWLLQK